MPLLQFVVSDQQSDAAQDIARVLRAELADLGVRSTLSPSFPAAGSGAVPVLVSPSTWHEVTAREHWPSQDRIRAAVLLGLDHPGTKAFERSVALARAGAGGVLDVHADTVDEWRRLGIAADHAPLGWSDAWAEPEQPERDVDAVYLGEFTDRRATALGHSARLLTRWTCRLKLDHPDVVRARTPSTLPQGRERRRLLRRTRVVFGIRPTDAPFFDWWPAIQAIASGAVLVHEHSSGHAPLEPERHFVTGRASVLGLLAQELLEDEEARRAMAQAAEQHLRATLPLRATAQRLAELAADLEPLDVPARATRSRHDVPPSALTEELPPAGTPADTTVRVWSDVRSEQISVLRAALKDSRLELLNMRRELRQMRTEMRTGRPVPGVELVAESPAYRRARPRVSVITALYNHAHHIGAALGSAAKAHFTDLELIVVDDGSTDQSSAAALAFMRSHPHIPMKLVRHPVNRGLGQARNTALDFARGDLTFVLDADNELYPRGLGLLVDGLDEEPGATFAYGVVEKFDQHGPIGLHNAFSWVPEWFREGNYIDAMALLRTDALRRHGGYTTDVRFHGWEDYELWCRIAEAGEWAVHVPEVTARYRVTRHSMLTISDISRRVAISMLIERNPRLMAGLEAPL